MSVIVLAFTTLLLYCCNDIDYKYTYRKLALLELLDQVFSMIIRVRLRKKIIRDDAALRGDDSS